MPTAPYAKLRANIAGAGNLSGALVGAAGATCQLSQDPAGLGSSWKYEIVDYPEGFPVPAGWTADAPSGVYYCLGLTPPSFTLPALPLWGKLVLRLTVNNGDPGSSGLDATQFVDKTTVVSTVDPGGGAFEDIAYGETNQWDALRKWMGPLKRNIRKIAAALGALRTAVAGRFELWLFDGISTKRITQTVVAGVLTTDATVTTALTLAMPASTLFSLAVRWHGRTAAGVESLRESSLVFRRVAAAAPTQLGTTADIFPTVKDDAAWGTPNVVVSGNNLLVQVTGKAATSITWDVEATWRDL
jgi:hypothetical protein